MKEKLIRLYGTICQCNDSRFIEGKQRLSNNNCPQFSDKELITVYLWGKAQQLVTRKAICNDTRNHLLEWFPKLPSYQAFCQRLNRLAAAFRALADIWTEKALKKELVFLIGGYPAVSGDLHKQTSPTKWNCSVTSVLCRGVYKESIEMGTLCFTAAVCSRTAFPSLVSPKAA